MNIISSLKSSFPRNSFQIYQASKMSINHPTYKITIYATKEYYKVRAQPRDSQVELSLFTKALSQRWNQSEFLTTCTGTGLPVTGR